MSLALADYQAALALGEERHFGRAARRLGVTQPALTARLRRVEDTLGVRLFDRGRGGATATEAGLVFMEGARRILDAADETSNATRGVAAGRGWLLRIGMTQIAAYQIVALALSRFREQHSSTRIKLVESTTASLEAALERGELDVAFAHPPLHSGALNERVLCEIPFLRFETDSDQPLIRYPRVDAPVLMGALGRREEKTDLAEVEADTILGAITLSAAGYGAFAAPIDFPHPHLSGARQSKEESEFLETSVIWKRLDRRESVRGLVDAAVECANVK
ncbi:MAG: LysR family transcriptional regulator [Rhodobacteraceae bacterium]|nr:LysR family transcriptional regulator [Paracoccaceae bacterium]